MGSGDRQTPGVHWPASLWEQRCSRPVRDYLKNKVGRAWVMASDLALWPPCSHVYVSIHTWILIHAGIKSTFLKHFLKSINAAILNMLGLLSGLWTGSPSKETFCETQEACALRGGGGNCHCNPLWCFNFLNFKSNMDPEIDKSQTPCG